MSQLIPTLILTCFLASLLRQGKARTTTLTRQVLQSLLIGCPSTEQSRGYQTVTRATIALDLRLMLLTFSLQEALT
ncbi:hypothetical protein O3P69_013782 [Scylla paramamosain]|uniref:Secreted protein n=1 Tax=Scylla paramamosain TaxID=85552 RepID=A0AAW0SQZ2_SCYPA